MQPDKRPQIFLPLQRLRESKRRPWRVRAAVPRTRLRAAVTILKSERHRGVLLGLIVLLVGIVGLLLPVLPGMPFVLLSFGLLHKHSARARLLIRRMPRHWRSWLLKGRGDVM